MTFENCKYSIRKTRYFDVAKKHWKYLVKTKFSELETVGPVDQQVNHIKDFIVAYNTAEFDDSLVLSESAGDGEDEEGAEEEEGDEEEEDDE